MIINNNGVTRTVFVFKTFVVKIPSIKYTWALFLKGLLANMSEKAVWQKASQKFGGYTRPDLLCPVIWASWGGWFLIMKRAQTCSEKEPIKYSTWTDAGFGGDDKPDNYGWYQGKIVKLDYPE